MYYFIIFSISSGVWSSPVSTGSTPLPCSAFSFLNVNGTIIMFGGDKDGGGLDDIYTLNINNMVNKNSYVMLFLYIM